jgi:HAD superfamily hydrolase (TIGR01549 family)
MICYKGALLMLAWKKIYFDLDNTLYSHEYAFEKAIQDCYQDLLDEWIENGITFKDVPLEDWFDVFKYFSDLFWATYEKKECTQVEYRRKRFLSTMKHFKLPCHAPESDRFHEKYYEKANNYVQPYPGLYQLLEYLINNKVELGIITNGKKKVQLEKFKKLKLYRYIKEENFFVSEEVRMEKPDPSIFKRALGVEEPSNALFIGDTWEHDIVGAINAGWDALFLNTQNRPRTTSHQPLEEFSRLTQILPYLVAVSNESEQN